MACDTLDRESIRLWSGNLDWQSISISAVTPSLRHRGPLTLWSRSLLARFFYDQTIGIGTAAGTDIVAADKLNQELRTATDHIGTSSTHAGFANLYWELRSGLRFHSLHRHRCRGRVDVDRLRQPVVEEPRPGRDRHRSGTTQRRGTIYPFTQSKLKDRRGQDSNLRTPLNHVPVLKAGAIDHSATPPSTIILSTSA